MRTYQTKAGLLKRVWWRLWSKPYKPQGKKKVREIEDIELRNRRAKAELEGKKLELEASRLEVEEAKIDYEKAKYSRKAAEEEEYFDDDQSVEPAEKQTSLVEEVMAHAVNEFIRGGSKSKNGQTRETDNSVAQESRRIIDADKEVKE